MATYLVCSTPVLGHVSPMIGVGEHLARAGHRVVMLTGSRFGQRVTAAGMEFRSLSGRADFDDRDADSYLPDRERYRGLARAQYDIQNIFVRTIPDQFRAVQEILREENPAAILVDGAFAGVTPLLERPASERPPIIAFGVTPLTQLSQDCAPSGMGMAPSSTMPGRLRNRTLNLLAKKVLFRPTQRVAEEMFREVGAAPLHHFVMDISSGFDLFLQLSSPLLEYPRSDLSPNVVFVGPVSPIPAAPHLPAWWADLDGSRPVVHVTQGTIANHDLTQLIRPTIDALAGADVLVVVSTGGGDIEALGALPENVRVAPFLPYDQLLPLTDVVITNGGFGGVQQALREGVPLIVAGDTEDKPEVAARVAWSGVGLNLRTGRPTAAALAGAVQRILGEPTFRQRAREVADDIARRDTLGLISAEVDAAVATWPSGVTR